MQRCPSLRRFLARLAWCRRAAAGIAADLIESVYVSCIHRTRPKRPRTMTHVTIAWQARVILAQPYGTFPLGPTGNVHPGALMHFFHVGLAIRPQPPGTRKS